MVFCNGFVQHTNRKILLTNNRVFDRKNDFITIRRASFSFWSDANPRQKESTIFMPLRQEYSESDTDLETIDEIPASETIIEKDLILAGMSSSFFGLLAGYFFEYFGDFFLGFNLEDLGVLSEPPVFAVATGILMFFVCKQENLVSSLFRVLLSGVVKISFALIISWIMAKVYSSVVYVRNVPVRIQIGLSNKLAESFGYIKAFPDTVKTTIKENVGNMTKAVRSMAANVAKFPDIVKNVSSKTKVLTS